jgi:hypothetical protein
VKRSVLVSKSVCCFPSESAQFSHPPSTPQHSAHSSLSARHKSVETFNMGKSDTKQTKMRAHKAKATDGETKHKKKPSFDAALLEATDKEEGPHQSQWRDLFRQLCEYKIQFGDCLMPQRYSANPKLGNWVSTQRVREFETFIRAVYYLLNSIARQTSLEIREFTLPGPGPC